MTHAPPLTRWEFRVVNKATKELIRTWAIAANATQHAHDLNNEARAKGEPPVFEVIPLSFKVT